MNQELDQQYQGVKYGTEQFEQSIVYIASGALGISFAFIKDIIPNLKGATHKDWLSVSWGIFACVIFCSLVGHFLSAQANQWAIKHNDLEHELFNKKIMSWNWPIRILNILMMAGILVGIFCLIYFVNQNLK